jgi:fructokinase
MSADQHQVFGLGEVLWDLLPQGKQLGGAPANFAYFVSALGARAFLVSRVGQDELGGVTLERLQALGLAIDLITRDPEHETGKASVELNEAGVPRFVIHSPAAWDFIPASAITLNRLASASAVCFGTLGRRCEVSRASVREMLLSVPRSALRIFDVNLRHPFYSEDLITEGLGLANVLKINESEMSVLSDLYAIKGGEVDRLRALGDRFGLQVVAMTSGSEGSIIIQGDCVSRHAAIATEVKDTVGAGDAFTAALVIGLLEGYDLDRLHRRAARLASYVCSQTGAMPRLPAGFADE